MYAAISESDLQFHMIHAKDESPIEAAHAAAQGEANGQGEGRG